MISNGRKLGIVMEFLEMGGEVTLDGRVYVLDEEGNLFIKGKKFNSNQNFMNWEEGEDTYMGANDLPLTYFMKLIGNMSEEEIMTITVNKVLNDYNRKER